MMMKKCFLVAACVGMAAMVSSVSAAPIWFDLGNIDTQTGGNYNNLYLDPVGGADVLSIADAIDETGAGTGIGIAVSPVSGANTSGALSPTGDAAIFDVEATRDSLIGRNNNPVVTFALTGLDGSGATLYDFTLFAARIPATDNREARYDISGANTGFALLDPVGNSSEVVTVPGIIPTAGGGIDIVMTIGLNNNNGTQWTYLGAFQIESRPVPEPTSLVLLAMGAVCSVTLRRRRAC